MQLPQPRCSPRLAWLQVPTLGHATSFPPWGGRGDGADGVVVWVHLPTLGLEVAKCLAAP